MDKNIGYEIIAKSAWQKRPLKQD